MTPDAEKKQPIASPYEIAQLAVSIAIMQGEKEADINEALELLIEAEWRTPDPNFTHVFYDEFYREKNKDDTWRPRDPWIVRVSPTTDPERWNKHIEELRSFPGNDRIQIPEDLNLTLNQLVSVVIQRRESSRIEKVIAAMIDAKALAAKGRSLTFRGEQAFWLMAKVVARFTPRFKALYRGEEANGRTRKQPRRTGRFHKPARLEDGRIKKS